VRRLVLLVAAAVGITAGAAALARAGGDPGPAPAAGPAGCEAPAVARHQHTHAFPHPPDPRGGLAASGDGVSLVLDRSDLAAGAETEVEIRLRTAAGDVPRLVPDGGVPMHLYLVRADLGSYQHVHPTAGADCGWRVRLRPPTPGRYRLFAAIRPEGRPDTAPALVLSRPLTVPGPAIRGVLPAASPVARTPDGYTLTLRGYAAARGESLLTVTVTRGGSPVRTLSPYLGAMAHLSVFREASLAFNHGHPLQPVTDRGGPTLTTPLLFPGAGRYRVFVQFSDGGAIRTAAFTLQVR
jgi:hypothetical protein